MFDYLSKFDWFKNSIDFLFPPLCLGCGEYTEEKYNICSDCLKKIEPEKYAFCMNCLNIIPNGIDCINCTEPDFPLLAYSHYLSPLKDIIIQYKFKGITLSSRMFAQLIYEQFSTSLNRLDADYLVPIPLYPSRENIRGYNQASIFAGYLSEFLKIKVNDDLIYRTKKRLPQARLKPADRVDNIRDVFKVKNSTSDDIPVIIVDDVVTSGSTILEARRVLQSAGYNVTGAISIAHAVR